MNLLIHNLKYLIEYMMHYIVRMLRCYSDLCFSYNDGPTLNNFYKKICVFVPNEIQIVPNPNSNKKDFLLRQN